MLLERILAPQDLKKLSVEELPKLAQEIRQEITQVVSANGGHLASSLGAVDLIIALHYCLDASRDRIIFDVGHQSYAHKILTAREKPFDTLRQYQGVSGFPCREESCCDAFTTGHSSTAVSLALGLACARDFLPREQHYKVAAVIGDGSLSGGLCFEGLNNAGHLKKDILVVLNTNEHSIAPNVGAISTYLNKIISLPVYNRFKSSLENFVASRMPKGSRVIKLANKFEEGLKGLFIPGMLFEELGFRYFGPLDGHDMTLLVQTVKNLIHLKGPILLHVLTKKGKGYPPAEKDPVLFHGTGPFDILTGGSLTPKDEAHPAYTEVFSETLLELAKKKKEIVAITAAMPEGTGLDRFRDALPARFFDVGIAEEHAVCFAAGLAKAGLKPVVAIYSTFLQRAYDQIIEDVCLQNLPVVFAIDRAGVVGEDGVTHQGLFDVSFLRAIPHLAIMAPKDGKELAEMLEFAVGLRGPSAIRYPRGKIPNPKSQTPNRKIELGKGEILTEGKDFVLLALGSMVYPAWEAVELLRHKGCSGTLINARFVKPLDVELFREVASKVRHIFSVEEAIIDGGFGSAVAEALDAPVVKFGLPSVFVPHGERGLLLAKYGLTAQEIAARIHAHLKKKGHA
jgi:1-deoxy-D-xylulose-5-phosphate synthase